MKDICCIGHITIDRVITPDHTTHMPGGTSYYFAKGISRLPGISFQLVTAVGPNETDIVSNLRKAGIDVISLPSRKTVFFENKYGSNGNQRTQRVLAKADPFTIEGIQTADTARIYHLGSLLADDFSPELVQYLSARGGQISVDVQGFLRHVEGETVMPVEWKNKMEIMPYINILKVNEYEMEVLTGKNEPHAAARTIGDWGVNEVCVTLGDYGSVIYADRHFYEIKAYPPARLTDPTGCGDTYSTGYLYCRAKDMAPDEAGRFAAAMSTLKLETSGPFSRTAADIRELMNRYD